MAYQKLFVKDIMTSKAVAVSPEDSVVYAAKLMHENFFSGLPVVDERGVVVGIVTEYDLISCGEVLHLPTLINVLGNIDIYKKDSSLVKDDLKRLMILKVKDVMNTDPLMVQNETPIEHLAGIFSQHHRVNPIPVVDEDKKLLGIVSRFDLVRFFVGPGEEKKVEVNHPAVMDKKVNKFINGFEKRFILVSRTRTRFWFMVSLLSIVVGFAIAFALVLRITLR